jgi:hypothetical protein
VLAGDSADTEAGMKRLFSAMTEAFWWAIAAIIVVPSQWEITEDVRDWVRYWRQPRAWRRRQYELFCERVDRAISENLRRWGRPTP